MPQKVRLDKYETEISENDCSQTLKEKSRRLETYMDNCDGIIRNDDEHLDGIKTRKIFYERKLLSTDQVTERFWLQYNNWSCHYIEVKN